MRRVVFLDIDGVLNAHEWCHGAAGPRIDPARVEILQIAVDRLAADGGTPVEFVLCSSWRYKIATGEVPLGAFAWMLRTHGLRINLVGITEPGEPDDRGAQILAWFELNGAPDRWLVVDDLPLKGIPSANHIRPNPGIGLEWYHATAIVERLTP